MAVLPELQRQGVGSVMFLGHPDYYSRFGFEKASQFGVGFQYDVSNESFTLVEMAEGASAASQQ